jgi:adenosylcobinamide kinase/adenosylcobinamide-phosphate guanylyltransferase
MIKKRELMGKLTFILGGARGGKSSLGQKLAEERGLPVLYIATAQALDEEMERRIQVHRQDRPQDWRTLESPRGVAQSLEAEDLHSGVILLDCLTLLVTNVMLAAAGDLTSPDEARAESEVRAEVYALLSQIQSGEADWIVVSNEVGMGLVPPYPAGRLFRDLLGWANQGLAAAANEVYWMVAGIPVPIHQFRFAEIKIGKSD